MYRTQAQLKWRHLLPSSFGRDVVAQRLAICRVAVFRVRNGRTTLLKQETEYYRRTLEFGAERIRKPHFGETEAVERRAACEGVEIKMTRNKRNLWPAFDETFPRPRPTNVKQPTYIYPTCLERSTLVRFTTGCMTLNSWRHCKHTIEPNPVRRRVRDRPNSADVFETPDIFAPAKTRTIRTKKYRLIFTRSFDYSVN